MYFAQVMASKVTEESPDPVMMIHEASVNAGIAEPPSFVHGHMSSVQKPLIDDDYRGLYHPLLSSILGIMIIH